MPARLDLPDDELVRLYQEGMSAYALGLRYGCTPSTVGKRLRTRGITPQRTSARVRAITRDALEQLIGQGLSDPQIARRFRVCDLTIRKLRHTYSLQPHPKHRKRSTKGTNGPAADAAPVIIPRSGRESTKDTKGTNGPAAGAAPVAMGGIER